MPELPEVEVAARTLRRHCEGAAVRRVTVRDDRIVRGQSARSFRDAMRSGRIGEVLRHGKRILVRLDAGRAWGLHLGMTGKLVFREPGERVPPHTRLVVSFEKGRLCFRDPRLFGGTTAGDEVAVRERTGWDRLGPDALALGRSGRRLAAALASRTSHAPIPIKEALMDQARLAGIGNIQAAEALHRARIHPRTSLDAIDGRAMARLARGIADSLAHTLTASGSDEIAYLGEGGENPFRVYGREGEPCLRCTRPIAREVQAGRATFFCSACQPVPTVADSRNKG